MAIDSGTVLFEADFPGKAYSYTARAEDKAKLAVLLSSARKAIAEYIYDYAPIDRKAIDNYFAGQKKPKNPAELAAILSSVSMSSIERDLEKAVKFEQVPADDIKKADVEKRKIGYATSYYLYLLFKSAFGEEAPKPAGSSKNQIIRLVSNSSEWMVVKKTNTATATKPEALSALIGMLSTIVRKEGDVLCKEGDFEGVSTALFGSFFKRKSFGKLCEAISTVPVPKVTEVADANAFDKSAAADELFVLLYLKAFSLSGYSPYPEPDLLAETYPQLKIPKPRGNFGGKKKKKA
ncbi:MAG: hypothetical protein WCX64_00065 [Candidatus Micrarchaeia archaeon]|jgi:hypothetical protein